MKITKWIAYPLMLAIMIIAIYFMTSFGKWISYVIFYESQVKQTIIEMVKPEALKE